MADSCNRNELGACSSAEGGSTFAIGAYAHAEGYQTNASGQAAHTEGINTGASGFAAHAEGYQNLASGNSAHAEGSNNTASGVSAHAEGEQTQAIANAAHAEGYLTLATKDSAHAEGAYTQANGESAHAEGVFSIANRDGSHAEGFSTFANNDAAHAEGSVTSALGLASHAEGQSTIAQGGAAHAEGFGTMAGGDAAHAEGSSTSAGGVAAHAEGSTTSASGNASHAEGIGTVANGEASHAGGLFTNAGGFAGANIIGRYGTAQEAYSWFIGNGTGPTAAGLGAKWLASTRSMYVDGAFVPGGADYAELFETADGQPLEPGYFVTTVGKKIRPATASDAYIVGITSAVPAIIGDSGEMHWHGKYAKDKWGRVLYSAPTVSEPDRKPLLSADWRPDETYTPRLQRPEWVPVGLLGKLLVRDDGTCEPDACCRPNDEGAATRAEQGFRVLARTAPDQVLVMFAAGMTIVRM